MSTTKETSPGLELDDVPIVSAVFLFAMDNLSPPIVVGDSKCKDLSHDANKKLGKKLPTLARELTSQKTPSHVDYNILKKDYTMLCLQASEDDKAVFLMEKNIPYLKELDLNNLAIGEDDQSSIVLPFLDGALSHLLSRGEIYGAQFSNQMPPVSDKGTSRSRRVSTRDSYSLEEVFRTIDVDGNGTLDAEEFYAGLSSMGLEISQQDTQLIFKAIWTTYNQQKERRNKHLKDRSTPVALSPTGFDENQDQTITYGQFFSFFGGRHWQRSAQRSGTAPATPAAFAALDIVTEQDLPEEDDIDEQKAPSPLPRTDSSLTRAQYGKYIGLGLSEADARQVAEVKQTILACLNFGEDQSLLSTLSQEVETKRKHAKKHKHERASSTTKNDSLTLNLSTHSAGSSSRSKRARTVSNVTSSRRANKITAGLKLDVAAASGGSDELSEDDDFDEIDAPARPQSTKSTKSTISTSSKSSSNGKSSSTTVHETFDVEKALGRVRMCEDILPIMESNLYLCASQAEMVKWENRFRGHKERINNFRHILNQALRMQVQTMKDTQSELMKELEKLKKSGGRKKRASSRMIDDDIPPELRSLAVAHNMRLSSSNLSSSVASPSMRKSFASRRGGRALYDDDDTASVDSETDLIYVPGVGMNSKETEEMMQKLVIKKKEVSKLKKENRDLQLELHTLKSTSDSKVNKLKAKIKASENNHLDLKSAHDQVRQQMRKLVRSNTSMRLVDPDAGNDAAIQRATSKLQREINFLTKELEKEKDVNKNTKERLKRALKNRKAGDKESGGASTVSQRKIARLEKAIKQNTTEISAKQKKLDDMFVRLKEAQSAAARAKKEASKMKHDMTSMQARWRDMEDTIKRLQNKNESSTKLNREITALQKKEEALQEKIAKLKARGGRMKKRLDDLLKKLKEQQNMMDTANKLRKTMEDLERRRRELESERSKSSEKNQKLEEELAQLQQEIDAKARALRATTSKLEEFKEDLSAEYMAIKKLQDELETKDQMLVDKDEEMAVQLAKLEAMVEQKDRVLSKYKSKIQILERENEELLASKRELLSKLDTKHDDFEELRGQFEAKVEELKIHNERRAEAEKELLAQNDSEQIQEKEEQIDELQATLTETEDREKYVTEKFDIKTREFEQLLGKWEELQTVHEVNQRKIQSLKKQIEDLNSKSLGMDDDTQVKLQEYEVQTVTIVQNRKQIDALEGQLSALRTDYELMEEQCSRLEKSNKKLQQDMSTRDDENDKLRKTVDSYKKKLNMSGVGKNKNASELELLRKNVIELESILRDKDFQIKKFKNQSNWSGTADAHNPEDVDKIKHLNSSLKKSKSKLEKTKIDVGGLRSQVDELSAKQEGMQDMLKRKNKEILQLKREKSSAEEHAETIEAQRNVHLSTQRRMSSNLDHNATKAAKLRKQLQEAEKKVRQMSKMEDKIAELQETVKQRDELIAEWSELLEK